MSARVAVVVCCAWVVSGCALLSKGEVPIRRYFSPDLPAAPATAGLTRPTGDLRLGRVTSGDSIGERIIYRVSDHEVGYYDDRLWTEKPELYLRRALTRVLFEEQGLHSVLRGAGPSLDVELITFEEVKAPVHLGRVKVAFSLSDDRLVALQQTLTVEKPIATTDEKLEASAVAQAMGEALREAVYEISRQVVAGIGKNAPVGSPCPVAATP